MPEENDLPEIEKEIETKIEDSMAVSQNLKDTTSETPKEKPKRKISPSTIILTLFILIVTLLAIGTIFYANSFKTNKNQVVETQVSAPSPTPEDLQDNSYEIIAGEKFNEYIDKKYNFSFNYPLDSDIDVGDYESDRSISVGKKTRNNLAEEKFAVWGLTVSENSSMSAAIKEYFERESEMTEDVEGNKIKPSITSKTIIVDGVHGILLENRITDTSGKLAYHEYYYLLPDKDNLIWIKLFTGEVEQNQKELVDTALSTFKFTQ